MKRANRKGAVKVKPACRKGKHVVGHRRRKPKK